MMEVEKKLALADLKTYQQDQNLRTLAKDIVKYQLFKVKSVIHKLGGEFAKTTKWNYFKVGARYIKNGVKAPKITDKLYEFIDEAVQQHVQPLTPSAKDRAREYNRKPKTEAKQPIFNIPQQLTQLFEYGVRRNNNIVIMPDDKTATNFINICKALDIDGVRIVNISVEEE